MRPLFQFLARHYFFFLFLLLEGLALTMLVSNSYYQRSVIVNSANGFTGRVYSWYSGITQYLSLKESNRYLAEENARLLNFQKSSFIKTDNKVFLKNDTLYRQQYEYVTAKVINNSTNQINNYLTINKGSKLGIKKGMAVVCSQGIVGIVNEVSENFATVISMLHPKMKISAKIKKNDYVGTIVWEGGSAERGSLKDIPTHVKIKAGDTVITSGYSLMFPEGAMIGTIKDFRVNKGNDFYIVDVDFSTDFNNVSWVYVVQNMMKDELDNLEGAAKNE